MFSVLDKTKRRNLIKYTYLKYEPEDEFVWCPKKTTFFFKNCGQCSPSQQRKRLVTLWGDRKLRFLTLKHKKRESCLQTVFSSRFLRLTRRKEDNNEPETSNVNIPPPGNSSKGVQRGSSDGKSEPVGVMMKAGSLKTSHQNLKKTMNLTARSMELAPQKNCDSTWEISISINRKIIENITELHKDIYLQRDLKCPRWIEISGKKLKRTTMVRFNCKRNA